MIAVKRCSSCKVDKPASGFHKDATRKDGRQAVCCECRRKWNIENRQYKNALDKLWYAKNSEYHLARGRLWRAENSEYHTARVKVSKLKRSYDGDI